MTIMQSNDPLYACISTYAMFHIEEADYASASLVQQSSGSEQNVITLIYVQNFPSYHLICIPLSLPKEKGGYAIKKYIWSTWMLIISLCNPNIPAVNSHHYRVEWDCFSIIDIAYDALPGGINSAKTAC